MFFSFYFLFFNYKNTLKSKLELPHVITPFIRQLYNNYKYITTVMTRDRYIIADFQEYRKTVVLSNTIFRMENSLLLADSNAPA